MLWPTNATLAKANLTLAAQQAKPQTGELKVMSLR